MRDSDEEFYRERVYCKPFMVRIVLTAFERLAGAEGHMVPKKPFALSNL